MKHANPKSASVFLIYLAMFFLPWPHAAGQISPEPLCPDCTFTKAYDAAEIYGHDPRGGLILYLHDCHGLDVKKGWQRQWLDYLVLRGFVVVAIDSFADERPAPSGCDKDPWLNLYKKIQIYSVRKLQAEHAVKQLKQKFPKQKVFVWGHSEGAVVAQLIAEKTNGVISTGAPCSTEWLPGMAHTPLLVIQGTQDPLLAADKTNPLYGSLDDRCKLHMTEPKWEWLTVKGMGNAAELSRTDVKSRITQFLSIPHVR